MKTDKDIKQKIVKYKEKIKEFKSCMEKFSKLNKNYDCTYDISTISVYEDLISELEWVLN